MAVSCGGMCLLTMDTPVWGGGCLEHASHHGDRLFDDAAGDLGDRGDWL